MTEPSPAGSRPAIDKKKSIIAGLLGLAVLVLIFWKVIPQIGSYSEALTALRGMSGVSIALIALMVILYNIVYGLPFMAATPGLSYPQSFSLNQVAFTISNGVPAGGAFGLGVQYAMLNTFNIPATAATAAIAAVGVWSIFVTLGLPVLGLLAIASSHTIDVGPYIYIGVIGLGVLVAMIVVFGLVMRSESTARSVGRSLNRAATPLLARFGKGAEFDAVEQILKFRSDTVDLVRSRWWMITIAQTSVSLLQFLIFFAALRGVEGEANPTPLLVAFGGFAVAQIGLMIPITPGGLGTVDAFMLTLLTAMGVKTGDATAAVLVWRAASFIPQIAVGILCLLGWSRQAAKKLTTAS
jgi:uncharacterized protein (TIRG00374 family)